jgi:hypothetical protein
MTPIEKAETALNRRLERLQVNLREASSESARRFLAQSMMVCVGLGEALTDYVRAIGRYAQRRHGELKQVNETLIAQHAGLLDSGNELLTQLKANPGDRTLRQEIERAQREMAAIQKTLRRGADSLQRDLAPSMGLVDKLSVSIRRFGEAEQLDSLNRSIGLIIENVEELYRAQASLPARHIIDAISWKKSVASETEQSGDFYEAYALGGFQALRAVEAVSMAVSEKPPESTGELSERADAAVATRLKAVAARFGAN